MSVLYHTAVHPTSGIADDMSAIALLVVGLSIMFIGSLAIYAAILRIVKGTQWKSWWPPDVMISFGVPILMVGMYVFIEAGLDIGLLGVAWGWSGVPGSIFRVLMAVTWSNLAIVMLGGGFQRREG